MSTTSVPARYSPSITDVTMEIPVRRSELNSKRDRWITRPITRGVPHISATRRGIACDGKPKTVPVVSTPNRRIRWNPMATSVIAAITTSFV